MFRKLALVCCALLSLSAALVLVALASGPAEEGAGKEVTGSVCSPPDVIAAYVHRIQIGRPRQHGSLTLYPILVEGTCVPEVDLTLDEAMERGLLAIRELDPPEVNRARVVSKAKEPIFLMGGEMMTGAKQDRIVGDDAVIPAHADLVIPVFCVEHGRWVAKSESFGTPKLLATNEVRKARTAADQSAVWSRVAETQERLAAPSATGALRSVQDSEAVQRGIHPYRKALSDFAADLTKARGVVACVGGEIIAADLFGSRAIFLQLWPKLLDSYIVEAVDREAGGSPSDGVRMKRWLDGIAHAERTLKKTPGDGTLYQLAGRSLMGSALLYEDAVVHIELFSTDNAEPVLFNRLEFRRERLEGE